METATMPPNRTYAIRVARWIECGLSARCECSGVLEILQSRKPGCKEYVKAYRVTEFPSGKGFPGRAFQLKKDDGEVRTLFLADSPHDSICDCEAKSYDTTRKADEREHHVHSDSLGCCHLDAMRAILPFIDHPQQHSEPIEEPGNMDDICAAIDAADAVKLGGYGKCPSCGELGTYTDNVGDTVCVFCSEVFPLNPDGSRWFAPSHNTL